MHELTNGHETLRKVEGKHEMDFLNIALKFVNKKINCGNLVTKSKG